LHGPPPGDFPEAAFFFRPSFLVILTLSLCLETAPHRKGQLMKIPNWMERVLQLHDTPESVARGVAVGTFVAITPTVGIHMVLAASIAYVLGVNRLAAVAAVWLTNPLTLLPIYWLDYVIGRWILSDLFGVALVPVTVERFREMLRPLSDASFWEAIFDSLEGLAKLGAQVAVPMFLGGFVLGVLLAIPAYYVALYAVRRYREIRLGPPSMEEIEEWAEKVWKGAKRLVVVIIGGTVLLFGVVMIVLPGPAVLVIPIGLAILGTEFAWARLLLNRVRRKTEEMRAKLQKVVKEPFSKNKGS
jgi:uncharacterized protein (DUF2062 family)